MVKRDEAEAEILRLHHVEKWPVGTIATHLHVHHSAVTRGSASGGAPPAPPQRSARIDAILHWSLVTRRMPITWAVVPVGRAAGGPLARTRVFPAARTKRSRLAET